MYIRIYRFYNNNCEIRPSNSFITRSEVSYTKMNK